MIIRDLREKINLYIYDSKPLVLRILSVLYVLVSLTAIATMVLFYGLDLNEDQKYWCFKIIESSFGFYIFRYLIRIFFDFNPPEFVRKNWFESIVIGLLLVEGIAYNFFGTMIIEPLFQKMGFKDFGNFSLIFVQMFVFVIIINDLFKKKKFKPWLKIHPALLFTISITTMSLIGGLLLMLPEMTNTKGGMSFVDSMFLSVSSVCVTGLSTVDLAEVVSFKGQVVVLILMKLGGLNIISFGALMLVVAKFGVGIKYHETIEDFVSRDSILKANSMLAKIVLWATGIEIIGTILLFIGFGDKGIFADTGSRFFHSVFHAVAGFNNAGLSTFSGGMMHPDVVDNNFTHMVILIMFFLGGFGMLYLFDVFEFKRLRERMKTPWKTIEFGTKISLYFTIGLLVAGAILFMIFEWNNTLKGKDFLSTVVTSFFQSMTPRTAGFNVVDTASLTPPILILFLFLMFIGTSSGSAGGGIKTSTFAIMWASVVSNIRGKRHTELFHRTLPNETVIRAYVIFLTYVVGNVIGPFILSFTEADLLASGKYDFMDLVFEHVSAAATTGLSTGLTAELSTAGKYVIIAAMFIGRVGTLTLIYMFGMRTISKNYKYPEVHTMVG